ncbi:MAGUK p55 subfamily member 7 isoform X4 [Cimex lectularius]|uniref:MAGUK p55 subfamily member 7 n=1 Tax=Cimex lectularius TaxID=79782 RepID=A0A8I6TMI9_CIMLE|nr:MAGUK p55 subfamily member 7 isoform X4 [Cimex lectularius]
MTAVMANGNWDPSLSGLLASLEESRRHLPSSEEEFGFLSELLQSKELHALVKVHNKIVENGRDDKLNPVLSSCMQVAIEVVELLLPLTEKSKTCKELFTLLQKPHLQGLMCAHDAVAQKDYYPRLPEIPPDVEDDEETIKIVQLVKSNEPLSGAQSTEPIVSAEPIVGATIKSDEETGKIVIARVMHGGAADRSGLIHVGDEVVEVNNINVEGKTPNDVLAILQASEGTITFKLVPADGRGGCRESKVRVRAHFDYIASSDPFIPCKEAGLDFLKGDILHIVSQDDGYWWQARKEGDRNMRAGLIPSRALQERRIIHERQTEEKLENDAEADDFAREELATYEEVAKLYPRPGLYRPLALVGPPGVGRNELKRRLIATDPNKYRSPIPFTSRTMRPGEVDGKDYYFVSRETMEEDVEAGKFIEYGEYKGNLYGTSMESVLSLINAGYVCILSPHYQALKMIRTAQIKPYIIYVKPPLFDTLKETRTASYARSTFDENNSRAFTDEELAAMIHRGERIEFMFSHLFDDIIVNSDLSAAFETLIRIAIAVETEPQWVPASWVQ